MHRLIVGAKAGISIDHINGNTLDNRKCNLRIATPSQNSMNQRIKEHSSHYKGVTWHRQHGKWYAQLKHNQHLNFLGLFLNEEDAARAYDAKAKELFGEFARLNFPPQG